MYRVYRTRRVPSVRGAIHRLSAHAPAVGAVFHWGRRFPAVRIVGTGLGAFEKHSSVMACGGKCRIR